MAEFRGLRVQGTHVTRRTRTTTKFLNAIFFWTKVLLELEFDTEDQVLFLIFRKGQEVSNQYKHVFRSNDHLTDNPGTFGGNNFKANYLENNVCIFYIQNILLFI